MSVGSAHCNFSSVSTPTSNNDRQFHIIEERGSGESRVDVTSIASSIDNNRPKNPMARTLYGLDDEGLHRSSVPSPLPHHPPRLWRNYERQRFNGAWSASPALSMMSDLTLSPVNNPSLICPKLQDPPEFQVYSSNTSVGSDEIDDYSLSDTELVQLSSSHQSNCSASTNKRKLSREATTHSHQDTTTSTEKQRRCSYDFGDIGESLSANQVTPLQPLYSKRALGYHLTFKPKSRNGDHTIL